MENADLTMMHIYICIYNMIKLDIDSTAYIYLMKSRLKSQDVYGMILGRIAFTLYIHIIGLRAVGDTYSVHSTCVQRSDV